MSVDKASSYSPQNKRIHMSKFTPTAEKATNRKSKDYLELKQRKILLGDNGCTFLFFNTGTYFHNKFIKNGTCILQFKSIMSSDPIFATVWLLQGTKE